MIKALALPLGWLAEVPLVPLVLLLLLLLLLLLPASAPTRLERSVPPVPLCSNDNICEDSVDEVPPVVPVVPVPVVPVPVVPVPVV